MFFIQQTSNCGCDVACDSISLSGPSNAPSNGSCCVCCCGSLSDSLAGSIWNYIKSLTPEKIANSMNDTFHTVFLSITFPSTSSRG